MAKKRLNKKVALIGSAFFAALVLVGIGGILYLSRDPEKFIKDGDAAARAAQVAEDPQLRELEYEKAEGNYRKALSLAKSDSLKVEMFFKLVDIYIETGQWPKVQGCWAGIIQIDSKNTRARLNRLKYVYIAADSGIRQLWEEVADQASEFLDLADSALLGEDAKQWESFKIDSKSVAEKLGAYLYICRGRARLEMARHGLVTDPEAALAQAVEDLDKAREFEAANSDIYLYLAQAAIANGEIQAARGNVEERQKAANKALEVLQQAVNIAGDNPRAHVNLLQVKRMVAEGGGREKIAAMEPEYLKLAEMFDSSADVYAALGGLYLLDPNNLDRALQAIEKAAELDKENVSYAVSVADLYYRRFSFYGQEADLHKAIKTAKAALQLPGAREMSGPRDHAVRLNRMLLYDCLANCYITQVFEPSSAQTEMEKQQCLADAEQAVREIEQLIGSGEAPQVVKWQGTLELAGGDLAGRSVAIRKMYTVYEQLKGSGVEESPPSYMRRSYAQLSYVLAKAFKDTVETGAAAEFLTSALNAGIMSTKPEALLDHAEVLMKLSYWSEAVSDINLFEETFGASRRSRTLRVRTLIETKQFDEAGEELGRFELDEPNEIKLKLALVENRINQLEGDLARGFLAEDQDSVVPGIEAGRQVVEPGGQQSGAADELMIAELKDYRRQRAELVDRLLSVKPNLVKEFYVGEVCRNYIAEGKTGKASDLLGRFLEHFPGHITALVYKRVLEEAEPAGLSQERLNEIREQVCLNIDDPYQRAMQLGIFYQEQNKLDKAAEQFKKFLGIEPLQAEAGVSEQEEPVWPSADAKFGDVERAVVNRLFDIALLAEDWQLAERIVEAGRSEDMDGCGGDFFAARLALLKGQDEEALAKLNECLKQRPVFSAGYLLRSRVNSIIGDLDTAINDAQKAATLNPTSGDIVRELALDLYRRNETLGKDVSSEQIIEARTALERAVALNPRDIKLPSLYAEFISEEEPERALAIRQRLHKIDPSAENAVLLGNMAMRIAVRADHAEQKEFLLDIAGSAFKQALALEPENEAILDSFAQYYRLVNQGEKAEELLAKTKDPGLLWRDYFRSRQFDKARQVVQELLKSDPNDIAAIKALLLVAGQTADEKALKQYSQRLLSLEDNEENRLFQVRSFLKVGLIKEAEHRLQSLREKFPDEPRSMQLEAQLAMRQGKLARALELINRSLEIDENNASAWRVRGEINYLMASYERAIIDLKRSKSLLDGPVIKISLAKAYMMAGREEDAITELKAALDNPQVAVTAGQLLEQIYLRSGRKQELKKFYEQTLTRWPDDILWKMHAAAFAVDEGEFELAERLYTDAWQLSRKQGEGNAEAFDGYLRALVLCKKPDKLFEEASKHVDGPLAPIAYLRMAEAKLKLADKDGAAKYYRKALSLAQTSGVLVSDVLRQMYSMLGSADALRICRELLKTNPDSVAANLSMFELMMMDSRYNKALDYINRCLQIERASSETTGREVDYIAKKVLVLQLAYSRTSDNNYIKQAVREYESLLVKMPNNTNVLNNLAYMLAEAGIRLPEALEYAERAHSNQPNNPDFMDTYAYVLYKSGKFSEAASLLRSALQQYEARQRPAPAEVFEHLGLVSEELNLTDEALAAYKQALETGADTLSDKAKDRIKKVIERLNLRNEN